MTTDAEFMRLAVRLGRKGLGRTSPNPPVGAVVVARGRVVGRGYHRRAGQPHAEVEALHDAGERVRGAALYVSLEPCDHHGRTPPCTAAVLAAGVRRVVFGVQDPNPRVAGRGAVKLRQHGVEVCSGVEAGACGELIAGFAKHVRTGLPLVTIKLAASLDGRIATRTGASRWITGEKARRFVHRLRNEVDAVMVGAGTVIVDDPALTCRIRGGRDPLRVVVDGRLHIPLEARVLTNDSAPGTLVATVAGAHRRVDALRQRGATVLTLPGQRGMFSLKRLMELLGKRAITSVLIEGGATLAAAALQAGVVDRLLCFVAPTLIGGDGRPMLASLGVREISEALSVRDYRVSRLGHDLVIRAAVGGADAV